MSNHFSATIPLTETPLRTEVAESRAALAYLIRHDATDLAEALGMTPYQGHTYLGSRTGKKQRTVPVWREGSLS